MHQHAELNVFRCQKIFLKQPLKQGLVARRETAKLKDVRQKMLLQAPQFEEPEDSSICTWFVHVQCQLKI